MHKFMLTGTFDPITIGHLDLIKRSLQMADQVIVAILNNANKRTEFSSLEREQMVKSACESSFSDEVNAGRLIVLSWQGLTVDLVKREQVTALVRGIRNVMDLCYEQTMASANQHLLPEVETVFLLSKPEHQFISSSLVKELASVNADYSALVPQSQLELVKQHFERR